MSCLSRDEELLLLREMLEISMRGRGVATAVVAPRPETTGANGGPPLVSTGTG